MKKLKVLDLYCGLGGLSLGFEFTGLFKVIGGIDNFDWAVRTFYENHQRLNLKVISKPQDMSDLAPERVLDDLGTSPDIVVGGPPCQGFSHAGRRLEDLKHDPRNEQVLHFRRFIAKLRPPAFMMENVPGILRTGQEKANALVDLLVSEYERLGYRVSWTQTNSVDYRVPQVRKRIVLVGILNARKPFMFPLPPCAPNGSLFNEPYYTVRDALFDLPSPSNEEPQEYEAEPKTPLQQFLRRGSEHLHNHIPTKHAPEMVERIARQIPGTRLYPNWNHSWYRLDLNRPSPTVKENHRAPFVHFYEHRSASPRECARLQTMPDRYRMLGPKTAQLIMVGNAVPAILSAHLATEIARQAFGKEPPIPWSTDNNPLLSDVSKKVMN